MFRRTYLRILLAVLPNVEHYLQVIAYMIGRIDRLTGRIERYLVEQAVALAEDARRRREAIQSVEAAFNRRDDRTLGTIGAAKAKLEAAAAARDKVSDFLAA